MVSLVSSASLGPSATIRPSRTSQQPLNFRGNVLGIMGNQQHRAAGAGESAHRLPNIVHSFGVESRAGFVEDEDVRVVHERPGDEHAPAPGPWIA